MLRDNLRTYQPPRVGDLGVAPNHEVEQVLQFIDKSVSGFPVYYKTNKDSDRENRISDFLVHHFQLCKVEQESGYLPYDFRKNPTQEHSGKETDIGVFILTRGRKPIPIIEFEAKRLSTTSNNEQYVYGSRGGIERFKRGDHSSHLKICGMFGYVQADTVDTWITKINSWVDGLSKSNADTTIVWGDDELLKKVSSFSKVDKFSSEHAREQSNDKILLWHYLFDLT